MTAKSIIEVEINASQFEDYYDLYQDYTEKLEKAPDEWKKTTEEIAEAYSQLDDFSKAASESSEFMLVVAEQSALIAGEIKKASASNNALLESLIKNAKAQKEFADETERGGRALEKAKKSAEGVAHTIFDIGKFLIKLGAWTGGIAGLGGLLGAISLKDLASSAVNTQKSARGLGMTPGQLTAFDQDYSRYVDQGALGSIADAQNSYVGRMWLARASGMDPRAVGSQDPGQVAGQLAIRAHDWWVNTPESMRTSENLQSTGFTQSGFSLSMMRQLGNTNRDELTRAAMQYQQDQGRFNTNDKDTDSWYGFLRQIKDAGNTIETSLKNKLVALAPDLQHFVDVLGKDAKKLLDDIFTPANLKSLEDGIDTFASYLGSDKFKTDMRELADLVGDVASALGKLHILIHGAPGTKSSAEAQVPNVNPGLDPDEVARESRGMVRSYGGISGADKALGYTRHMLSMPFGSDAALSALDSKNGLPAGTLAGMWQAESGRGSNLVGPVLRNGDQAIGDFQFTGQAWKDWGNGGDRFNFNDESKAAGAYMSSLMKKYDGDVRKSLAAYNWGPAKVDRDIEKNGNNWQSGLPPATRAYLDKVTSILAKRQTQNVSVTIHDNTAARVAVQTNAAATQ